MRHTAVCRITIKRFIEIVGADCRPQALSPLEWSEVKAKLFDFPAVRFAMGHEKRQKDMSERYSMRIDDDRIAKVCNQVRQWLFGKNL